MERGVADGGGVLAPGTPGICIASVDLCRVAGPVNVIAVPAVVVAGLISATANARRISGKGKNRGDKSQCCETCSHLPSPTNGNRRRAVRL